MKIQNRTQKEFKMKNEVNNKEVIMTTQTETPKELVMEMLRPNQLNDLIEENYLKRSECTSIKETITNIRQGIGYLDYTIHNDLDFCINGTESEEVMRDRVIQIQTNLYQWMNYLEVSVLGYQGVK